MEFHERDIYLEFPFPKKSSSEEILPISGIDKIGAWG